MQAGGQQVQCTPCGTLAHRIWECPSQNDDRVVKMKASEIHIGARAGGKVRVTLASLAPRLGLGLRTLASGYGLLG